MAVWTGCEREEESEEDRGISSFLCSVTSIKGARPKWAKITDEIRE